MIQSTQQDVSSEREADVPGPPKWLRPLRDRVVRRHGGLTLWRGAIAVLGFAVVAGGVVLLPLPGPGWAIIFGGLAIWATEFSWAQRLLSWARRQVAGWTEWFKARSLPMRVLITVLGLALLAAVLYASWYFLL